MAEVIQISQISKQNNFPQLYFDIANENHFWCRWRFEVFWKLILSKNIPVSEPLRILEIGCGNGIVRKQIESHSSWITDGTDLDISGLQKNPSLRGITYLYDIYEQKKEFAQKYDGIVLFDVLEHIENPTQFINTIAFYVKPGGWLFVNVPAGEILRSAYDNIQGHLRRYNKKLIKKEFQNSEFQIRKLVYWGMSLIPLLLLRKLILAFTSEKDIYRTGFQPPSALFNTIMILLMKFETSIMKNCCCGASLFLIAQKNG